MKRLSALISKDFWDYAGERAIKTAAQVAVASIGSGTVGIIQVDFLGILSLAGGSALVSILTSIANFDKIAAGETTDTPDAQ